MRAINTNSRSVGDYTYFIKTIKCFLAGVLQKVEQRLMCYLVEPCERAEIQLF